MQMNNFFSILHNNSLHPPPALPPIIFLSSSSFKPGNPSSSSSSSFSSTGRIFYSKEPRPLYKKLGPLAARDITIDFGKHKGKMLGALPSSYLKWVSENLRAGDSEYWAKLADQVLDDPVYQDRIEWEFAEKILHGSNETMRNEASMNKNYRDRNSVSMLFELSERFGWDNEDKKAWSKVDFELLGTSKSGRIPRLTGTMKGQQEISSDSRKEIEGRASTKEPEEDEDADGERRRRRERRERMRGKGKGEREEEGKTVIKKYNKVILGNSKEATAQGTSRPFPGRESLLRKALNRRRFQ